MDSITQRSFVTRLTGTKQLGQGADFTASANKAALKLTGSVVTLYYIPFFVDVAT